MVDVGETARGRYLAYGDVRLCKSSGDFFESASCDGPRKRFTSCFPKTEVGERTGDAEMVYDVFGADGFFAVAVDKSESPFHERCGRLYVGGGFPFEYPFCA